MEPSSHLKQISVSSLPTNNGTNRYHHVRHCGSPGNLCICLPSLDLPRTTSRQAMHHEELPSEFLFNYTTHHPPILHNHHHPQPKCIPSSCSRPSRSPSPKKPPPPSQPQPPARLAQPPPNRTPASSASSSARSFAATWTRRGPTSRWRPTGGFVAGSSRFLRRGISRSRELLPTSLPTAPLLLLAIRCCVCFHGGWRCQGCDFVTCTARGWMWMTRGRRCRGVCIGVGVYEVVRG